MPVDSRRDQPGAKPHRHKRSVLGRWLSRLFTLSVFLIVLTEMSSAALVWVTPPRTAFMLQDGEPIAYQYVSIDHISRYVLAAVIAHEDQELGTRPGPFSWQDLAARAQAYVQGKPDPSGSTIPQQLAKNIYLWPGQNGLRKALEAGLATELSFTLTSKRVLELYLNYAQFGPRLYGICAASWYYFKTPPWAMTENQSAQLMGVLPLPNLVQRARGGGILLSEDANPLAAELVNGAANVWVPRQIEAMGGWEKTVATVGITDTARDHEALRGAENACSEWPQTVIERYNRENLRLDSG